MKGRRIYIAAALLIAGLAAGLGALAFRGSADLPPLAADVMVSPKSFDGFALTRDDGKPYAPAELDGKWTFVFFGYTHCPDVCPTTLTVLRQVRKNLVARHAPVDKLQVLFISVDPKRDTIGHLRDYVHYFGEGMIGATGQAAQIHAAEQRVGAVHSFGPVDANGDYTVNHSSYLYLIDPRDRLVARFSGITDAEGITDRYLAVRGVVEAQGGGVQP
jgi:protein SCO1/2